MSSVCGFHSVCAIAQVYSTIDNGSNTEQKALFSGLVNWRPLLFLSQKKHSSNSVVENPKLAVRKSTILFVGHKTAWPGEMGDLLKQKKIQSASWSTVQWGATVSCLSPSCWVAVACVNTGSVLPGLVSHL